MQQSGSTNTRGTTPRLVPANPRRGKHPRPTPSPATQPSPAPHPPARLMRALDVSLTPEQKDELWAMTRVQRIEAMLAGRLTMGQQTAWSRGHEAEVPLIGNEFAYIARYDPEYCETGEKRARP